MGACGHSSLKPLCDKCKALKLINKKIVRFKSLPHVWEKEATVKNNTVRVEDTDERFVWLKLFASLPFDLVIELENSETHQILSRQVLDVTVWKLPDFAKRIYIITYQGGI